MNKISFLLYGQTNNETRMKQLISNLVKTLEKLDRLEIQKSDDFERVHELVGRMWLIVYKIGKMKNVYFTDDQKLRIGSLIDSTLDFLTSEISIQTFTLNGELLKLTLKKRSGIQFFIDLFKEFPVSNDSKENLKEKLKDFEKQEEVFELTDELRNWSEDKTYFIETPIGIPESHTWWQWFAFPEERKISESNLYTETRIKFTCVIFNK